MIVLVTGGRDFVDKQLLWDKLDALHADIPIHLLVHGGAEGADTLAGEWAVARGVHCEAYPKDNRHGKTAGRIRNAEMFAAAKPDIVVACPGGDGTAHMVQIAKAHFTPVHRVSPLHSLKISVKIPD